MVCLHVMSQYAGFSNSNVRAGKTFVWDLTLESHCQGVDRTGQMIWQVCKKKKIHIQGLWIVSPTARSSLLIFHYRRQSEIFLCIFCDTIEGFCSLFSLSTDGYLSLIYQRSLKQIILLWCLWSRSDVGRMSHKQIWKIEHKGELGIATKCTSFWAFFVL